MPLGVLNHRFTSASVNDSSALMVNDSSVPLAAGSVIMDRYDMSIGSGFVFASNLLNDGNSGAVPSLGVSLSFADPADQIAGDPMLDGADLNALGIVTGTLTDSHGVARPSGGAFDIGAFELAE